MCSAPPPIMGGSLVVDRDSAQGVDGPWLAPADPRARRPGRARAAARRSAAPRRRHYMQRTALPGSPDMLTASRGSTCPAALRSGDPCIRSGSTSRSSRSAETLAHQRRTVTESRRRQLRGGSAGTIFYAHMDDIAAQGVDLRARVAHGYFVLSAAAGLFVDPAPGPCSPTTASRTCASSSRCRSATTIHARLTCKQKTAKEDAAEGQAPQGVVAWDVEVAKPERRAGRGLYDFDTRPAGTRGPVTTGLNTPPAPPDSV